MGRPTKHQLKDYNDEKTQAWCSECERRVRVRWYVVKNSETRVGYCAGNMQRTPEQTRVTRIKHRAASKRRAAGIEWAISPERAARRVRKWVDVWGISQREISLATGVSQQFLSSLTWRNYITIENHDAVMAYRPEWSRIGLARRVEALLADGYTKGWIAARLHFSEKYVWDIRHQKRTSGTTARKLIALYDKCAGTDPVHMGVDPQSVKCNVKRLRYYTPSKCWDSDTIDNPKNIPQWTGRCGSEDGYRLHLRQDIRVWRKVTRTRTGPVIRESGACGPCLEAHQIYANRNRNDAGSSSGVPVSGPVPDGGLESGPGDET